MNWLERQLWVLRSATRSLLRTRGSAAAAVLTVAITLSLSGLAALLQIQVVLLQDHWQDKVELSAYLCTNDSAAAHCAGEPGAERIDELGVQIALLEGVARVYFESPAQAYTEFQRRFQGTEIARSVEPDALPGSFRIKLDSGASRDVVVRAIAAKSDVEVVQDQKRMLNGFFTVISRVRVGSLVFAAAQSLTAVMMIAHLLRTSLRYRRREVEIMSLVGAPPRLVRGPFVFEALAVCGIASVLSASVLSAGVAAMGPMLDDSGALLARTIGVADVLRVSIVLMALSLVGGWVVSRWTLRHALR